ncbi:unnamed protein product, partial [Chrysoparadoxa australica]
KGNGTGNGGVHGKPSGGAVRCQHCNRPGHQEDGCWKLHPDKRPARPGGDKQQHKASAAAQSTATAPVSAFTRSKTPPQAAAQEKSATTATVGKQGYAVSLPESYGISMMAVDTDGLANIAPTMVDDSNTSVEVSWLIDTGASAVTISGGAVRLLRAKYPTLSLTEAMPTLALDGHGGQRIEHTRRTVCLNVGLILDYGMVNLRGIKCAVDEGTDAPLLILSRSVLEHWLGLKVERIMRDIYDRQQAEKDGANQDEAPVLRQCSSLFSVEALRESGQQAIEAGKVKVHEGDEASELSNLDDLPQPQPPLLLDVDIERALCEEQLRAAIRRAAEHGMPAVGLARLRRVVLDGEQRETFRASLGHDPPANVEPMRVTLKQGAEPIRARARKAKPEARRWLHEFMQLLVAAGLVYVNAQAVWASCVMARPKPGGKGYRMVGDFRPPNSVT